MSRGYWRPVRTCTGACSGGQAGPTSTSGAEAAVSGHSALLSQIALTDASKTPLRAVISTANNICRLLLVILYKMYSSIQLFNHY